MHSPNGHRRNSRTTYKPSTVEQLSRSRRFTLRLFSVPTLVQLLKDIDSAEDIVDYVQPYIGSVAKAKDFAHDFIVKRKQLANAGVGAFVVVVFI